MAVHRRALLPGGQRMWSCPGWIPPPARTPPPPALALDFFSEGREQKALLQFENGRRSSVINGVKKKTGSALVGKVCAVIFSPEHLLLVKEGPARRRGFPGRRLGARSGPSYAGMLHVYQRALSQRNALLKDIGRFPELRDTLEVWDARLIQLGAAVMEERRRYVEKIAPQAQEIYRGISRGKEELSLSYAPSPRLPEGSSQQDWIELFKTELRRTEALRRALGLYERGAPPGRLGNHLGRASPPGCTAPRGSSAAPCWP